MSMKSQTAAVIFDKSPPLPEDIIFFEIFARLPIRSLLKFRLVSKFCSSLTTDPQFIAAHRRCSQPCYLLSYSTCMLAPSESESHTVFNYTNTKFCTNPETKAFRRFKNHSYKYSNAKSINGLMCMVQGNHIIIRNLVSKEEFKLPYYHPLSELHKHDVYFSYCPKENKYKVILSTLDDDVSMKYSIFTLGVDKKWRRFRYLGLYQLGRSKSICIDGVLYCTNFLTTSVVNTRVIATFDVRREKFRTIRYPEELSPLRYSMCHLIEVHGAIAIVDLEGFNCDAITIWIREKTLKWIEIRVLLPLQWVDIYNMTSNFSFTTNSHGDIVLAYCGTMTTNCSLFLYNMEGKEWRTIKVLGLKPEMIFGDFLIEEYVEAHLLQGQGSLF